MGSFGTWLETFAIVAVPQSWICIRLKGDFVFDPSQYQPSIGADSWVVLVSVVLLDEGRVFRLISLSRLRHRAVEPSSK